MKHVICTDVWRNEGTPLYTVKVYDIDTPVNSHSYDCIFYEQGRDLDNLLQLANEKIIKHKVMKAEDIVKLSVDKNGHQTVRFTDKCQIVSFEPISKHTIQIEVKNK